MTVTNPARNAAHAAGAPNTTGAHGRGNGHNGGLPGGSSGARAPGWARRPAAPRQPAPPEPPQPAQPQPAQPAPSEPAPHDPAAADLRGQVVHRLRQMSALHAQHAWYRRNRDPIGPHGVAFLYAEVVSHTPSRFRLRTATRLVRDGPDVADAPRLLYELAGIARGYFDAAELDPRTQMADRCEPMSDGAFYLGLALSTLDTPTGTWPEVRQRVAGPLDIPGRGLALLSDGTMLLVDRRGRDEYGAFHVQCTHSLDVVPGQPDLMWRWNRDLANLDDPSTLDTWHFMSQLHILVMRAGRGR